MSHYSNKIMKSDDPFVNFSVTREYLDENGIWNPSDEDALKAAFQVNVFGSREHYLQLADFIRKFAEKDTSTDGDHHEHFENILSVDENVRLHLILRKDDVGDSCWSDCFSERANKP